VQFNPALGPNQIQIYLSENQPWLGIFTALGMIILPFDIFSNLALGPWMITAPGFNHGNTWTTPDETVMDLEPWSYNSGTGADLEYGSGPFVLVDDAAAVPATTFRLDAYRSGLTYGPGLTTSGAPTITTDHSYFWSSPVRQSDQMAFTMEPQSVNVPGTSSPLNWYYKIAVNEFDAQLSLTNYATAAEDVSVQMNVQAEYYNGVTWTAGSTIVGTTTDTNLAAGAMAYANTTVFSLGASPAGTTYVVFHLGWTITASGHQYNGAIYLDPNVGLAGDLAGGSNTAPYWGANGVVNLSDLGIVTGNWQAHVNWATVNPDTALAKADINGNGIVNLADLGFITGHWQAHWNINAPAPTYSIPIA